MAGSAGAGRAARWLVLALVVGLALAAPRLLLRSPGLLTVSSPESVGLEGLEVLVRFHPSAEPATFRALLNGADVTDQLEVAPNGAHGSLHTLLSGTNVLRFEVFGRGVWPPEVLVEESAERRVEYDAPLNLDRG